MIRIAAKHATLLFVGAGACIWGCEGGSGALSSDLLGDREQGISTWQAPRNTREGAGTSFQDPSGSMGGGASFDCSGEYECVGLDDRTVRPKRKGADCEIEDVLLKADGTIVFRGQSVGRWSASGTSVSGSGSVDGRPFSYTCNKKATSSSSSGSSSGGSSSSSGGGSSSGGSSSGSSGATSSSGGSSLTCSGSYTCGAAGSATVMANGADCVVQPTSGQGFTLKANGTVESNGTVIGTWSVSGGTVTINITVGGQVQTINCTPG